MGDIGYIEGLALCSDVEYGVGIPLDSDERVIKVSFQYLHESMGIHLQSAAFCQFRAFAILTSAKSFTR